MKESRCHVYRLASPSVTIKSVDVSYVCVRVRLCCVSVCLRVCDVCAQVKTNIVLTFVIVMRSFVDVSTFLNCR